MRGVLVEGIVNSVFVVIVHPLADQAPKMFLVERDDVVRDFAPAASDPSLGDSILPRRSHSLRFGFRPVALMKLITSASSLESRSKIR
jgi:hypothetical protein